MRASDKLAKLEGLIPLYAKDKEAFDYNKKLCDSENAQIKKLMTELDLDTYMTEEYKVTKSIQVRQKLNEDILLDMFLTIPAFRKIADDYKILQTKSYVDMDVLEKAIYDGGFSNEQLLELNKAMESKEIVSLRISKAKKQEDEDVY